MTVIDDIGISVKEISNATLDLQKNVFDLRQEAKSNVKIGSFLNDIHTSNGGKFKSELLDNDQLSLSYISNKYAVVISKEMLALLFINMPPKFTVEDILIELKEIDNLSFSKNKKSAQMIMKAFTTHFEGHCTVLTKPKQRTVVQKK